METKEKFFASYRFRAPRSRRGGVFSIKSMAKRSQGAPVLFSDLLAPVHRAVLTKTAGAVEALTQMFECSARVHAEIAFARATVSPEILAERVCCGARRSKSK